jgi:hypothetical protein
MLLLAGQGVYSYKNTHKDQPAKLHIMRGLRG